MQDYSEVIIIGGGVMGCSLAYHLTKLGTTDVTLLEKNELTAGSTWHAAGLCTHYAHNATVMNLRAHSVRLYRGELQRDTGQAVSFHATGALRVTRRQDRLHEYKHVQSLGSFVGHEFNILTPAELKAIYPLVNTDALIGAIHEPCDGYVDPSQATHAFAHGARQRGATIHRHTEVHAIERQHDQWRVSTSAGTIHCRHIVNAAGTWCREIGNMMGVDLPVVPMLHQYLVTDSVDAFAALPDELPFIRDPDESWYMRQERDGLIIGPYEKNGVAWSVDGVPPDFGMELLPADLDRIADIVDLAMQRVPAAADGGIKTIVNGPITFTPDANPLIGPAFGLNNAWVLTGSSMGVMEGGGAGDFLARWMINGEPPADALAVDARRFGAYADRSYRVDKAIECFAAQFGIHYPFEERPAARNQRISPIHTELSAMGAVFGTAYGYERANYFARDSESTTPVLSFSRPNWFNAVAAEVAAVADSVGVTDLGAFAKFTVRGQSAAAFIDSIGCNKAPPVNRLNLNLVLYPGGGVRLEFSVCRLAADAFLLLTAATAERIAEDFLRTEAQACTDLQIDNDTNKLSALGVMGPNAQPLLQSLTESDLSQASFPWFGAWQINIANLPVTALRVSYIGENGWELFTENKHLPALFKAIQHSGQQYSMHPFGAFAINAMRLEKAYRAWGSDYSSERTPLEAGVAHLVNTDNRQFTGRDAMLARAQKPDHWQMQLLSLDVDRVDPFYLHPAVQHGEPVGIVTSGAFGHRCQQALALSYFRTPPDPAAPLQVTLLGEPVDAHILDCVPFDPDHRLPKADNN